MPDLFPFVSPGVNTSRDLDLVAVDRDRLEDKMAAYFDEGRSDEEARRIAPAPELRENPAQNAAKSRVCRLPKRDSGICGYVLE
jgi:hypothetical protein